MRVIFLTRKGASQFFGTPFILSFIFLATASKKMHIKFVLKNYQVIKKKVGEEKREKWISEI